MFPSSPQKLFYLVQILFGLVFPLILFLLLRSNQRQSQFKKREFERSGLGTGGGLKTAPSASHSNQPPFALPRGIDPRAPAHDILGVSPSATEREILDAYRMLMKSYHPDRIARAGTPEWHRAQEAATAINTAKDEMLRLLIKR